MTKPQRIMYATILVSNQYEANAIKQRIESVAINNTILSIVIAQQAALMAAIAASSAAAASAASN